MAIINLEHTPGNNNIIIFIMCAGRSSCAPGADQR